MASPNKRAPIPPPAIEAPHLQDLNLRTFVKCNVHSRHQQKMTHPSNVAIIKVSGTTFGNTIINKIDTTISITAHIIHLSITSFLNLSINYII